MSSKRIMNALHPERGQGIAVLASGRGTTFEVIHNTLEKKSRMQNAYVSALITDRPCAAVEKARARSVVAYICGKKTARRGAHFYDIDEILQMRRPMLIVLAGFLGILPRWFTSMYARKIINIHPSLLPAYGGKGMYGDIVHTAVLENKEKRSGCSVHWVTDVVDGGALIAQRTIAVRRADTVQTLRERVQRAERKLYPAVVLRLIRRYNEQQF